MSYILAVLDEVDDKSPYHNEFLKLGYKYHGSSRLGDSRGNSPTRSHNYSHTASADEMHPKISEVVGKMNHWRDQVSGGGRTTPGSSHKYYAPDDSHHVESEDYYKGGSTLRHVTDTKSTMRR